MEFFELYGSYFNQQEVGISLLDGGSYYSKRQRGWFNPAEPRLLSIEDPGDPCTSPLASNLTVDNGNNS